MRNEKGFSLIELMIVIAIIGIIASFATASYNDSVVKSKRADAKATLMDISAQLERCFTANGQYTTDGSKTCAVLSSAGALDITPISQKGYYDISLPVLPTETTYTLQAAPRGSFHDDKCATLTLTNTGAKRATGTVGTANPERCW